MLHVLNGDATRVKLEPSGVPGEFTIWADVLHEGPVLDLPPAAFRAMRAAHLAAAFGETEKGAVGHLEDWDAALDAYGDHDEVVFWFEHDLFDQLILIRHLHWLSTIDPGRTRFSLICIDEYLGLQSPQQLAALFPQRVPITPEQMATGVRGWNLFRSPDPRPLVKWVNSGGAEALQVLPAALWRYFEEFPSVRNGLSRSERQILSAVAAWHHKPADAFRATQQMEERMFMGDAIFWWIVRRLAHGRHPLLEIDRDLPEMSPRGGHMQLTATGSDVLAGNADYVALNGIDRWLGGVHLTPSTCWRWNGTSLVS